MKNFSLFERLQAQITHGDADSQIMRIMKGIYVIILLKIACCTCTYLRTDEISTVLETIRRDRDGPSMTIGKACEGNHDDYVDGDTRGDIMNDNERKRQDTYARLSERGGKARFLAVRPLT